MRKLGNGPARLRSAAAWLQPACVLPACVLPTYILAACVLAALCSCRPAHPTAPSKDERSRPASAQPEPLARSTEISAAAARPVVLVDSYHAHNFLHRGLVPGEHNYHCYTGLRRAIRLLEARGCETRELIVGPLTEQHLSDVRLIVLNLPSMDRPPWLVSEIAAVEQFLRRGGGMIFVTDHSNCYYHQYHLLPLWDRLGLIPTFETVCERNPERMLTPASPAWLLVRDFRTHAVTDRVGYWAMQTGGRVVAADVGTERDDEGILAWTSDQAWADAGLSPLYGEGPVGLTGDMRYSDSEEQGRQGVLLVRAVGQGRVVVFCDQNAVGDAVLPYAHNWRLWANACRWCGRFDWDQTRFDSSGFAVAPEDLDSKTAAAPGRGPENGSSSTSSDGARTSASSGSRPEPQTASEPLPGSAFDAIVRAEPDRNASPEAPADAWSIHCWEPMAQGRFHFGGGSDAQFYNFWCWMNRWYWAAADDAPLRPRETSTGKPMLWAVASDLADPALCDLARATLAEDGKVLLLPSENDPSGPAVEAGIPSSQETRGALDVARQIAGADFRAEDLHWQSEPVEHWGAAVAGGKGELVVIRSAQPLRNADFPKPDVAPDGRQLQWQSRLHRWLFQPR